MYNTATRIRQRLLIITLLFGMANIMHAGEDHCAIHKNNHYQVIKTSTTFMSSAVGIGGVTPQEVIAFRCIMQEPKPARIFKQLLKQSQTAGRLYAMTGLYKVDRQYFEQHADSLFAKDLSVKTLMGCFGSEYKVEEVMAAIKQGVMTEDFLGRGVDREQALPWALIV